MKNKFWSITSAAAFLICLLILSPPLHAQPENTAKATKILALYSHHVRMPWDSLMDEGVREALADRTRSDVDLSVEYLDLSSNSSRDYRATLLHLLTLKYAASPPDVIVSSLEYSDLTAIAPLRDIFPKAKFISSFNDASFNEGTLTEEIRDAILPTAYVYNESRSYSATLSLIARLLPETTSIYFISGDAPQELDELAYAKKEFEKFQNRYAFFYFTGLPLDQLLWETGRLPQHSAIIFPSYFHDSEGRTYIPRDVLTSIHQTARAPIFGLVDTLLGSGIMGGDLISAEELGKKAGELALDIIDRPESETAVQKIARVRMFDWRELNKWGIRESLLPEGSIIRYREYTFWEKYRWHVIGGISLILLESGLIAFLLLALAQRRKAEEDKKTLEQKLHQAQKMEAIGTLAGGIAHDFNNILAAMIGNTELAALDLKPDSMAASSLQEVITSGNRAKELVNQILTFARKSTGETKPIPILPVATDALKLLRSTLPSCIDIQKKIESDAFILADPTKIHQIFINLCVNAAHAMPGGGVLTVAVTDVSKEALPQDAHPELSPNDYLQIAITDTGNGILPEHLHLIFEPYFTTKTVGSGTGLGLSVVHGIVRSYGGDIFVDTAVGKGTTFSVYLPTTPPKDTP